MGVQRVGIVFNARLREAQALAKQLAERLARYRVWVCAAHDLMLFRDVMPETSVVITVGGDGTILRAVHLAAPHQVPIVGVNLGRVGFMAEVAPDQALGKVEEYLSGTPWIEERMMVSAEVFRAGVGSPAGTLEVLHGLNDVVVGRAAVSRLLSLEVKVDRMPFHTYAADALIVATPTGSTGYALAAGGPVMHPGLQSLLLQPVAPHLTLASGVVLHPSAVVELVVQSDEPALLSVDGFQDCALAQGDSVRVQQSPYRARFLRAGPPSYFYSSLVQKLVRGGHPKATV
ncbi:MAG: NAD(+)/NADH kinase [Chloroflexi bacterium]|nr:NAD(+)/NADH kinase [Chloroflexota bacterium]